MNRISHCLTALVRSPLIFACLAGAVQAADVSASRSASAASHAHGSAPHAGRAYITVAGDTADRVVKKAMADIPLKDDILRDALIQANPKVFTAGAKTRLKPGTELALPDPHPMLRQILMPLLEPKEAGAYFPPPPVSVEERRRWVRFP
jgi:Tfp pilus assembly protein FimV